VQKLCTDLLIGKRAQAFIVQDQIQLLFSTTHATLSLDFFLLVEGSLIRIYHRLLIFSIDELESNLTPLTQEKRSLDANYFTLLTNHYPLSTRCKLRSLDEYLTAVLQVRAKGLQSRGCLSQQHPSAFVDRAHAF